MTNAARVSQVHQDWWTRTREQAIVEANGEELHGSAVARALAGERVYVVMSDRRAAERFFDGMKDSLDNVYALGTTATEVLGRVTIAVMR